MHRFKTEYLHTKYKVRISKGNRWTQAGCSTGLTISWLTAACFAQPQRSADKKKNRHVEQKMAAGNRYIQDGHIRWDRWNISRNTKHSLDYTQSLTISIQDKIINLFISRKNEIHHTVTTEYQHLEHCHYISVNTLWFTGKSTIPEKFLIINPPVGIKVGL